jgi:hypothetical protein
VEAEGGIGVEGEAVIALGGLEGTYSGDEVLYGVGVAGKIVGFHIGEDKKEVGIIESGIVKDGGAA